MDKLMYLKLAIRLRNVSARRAGDGPSGPLYDPELLDLMDEAAKAIEDAAFGRRWRLEPLSGVVHEEWCDCECGATETFKQTYEPVSSGCTRCGRRITDDDYEHGPGLCSPPCGCSECTGKDGCQCQGCRYLRGMGEL